MSSTFSSISTNARRGASINNMLCERFNVKSIVQNEWVSKERRAELFLLGAEFDSVRMAGDLWNIMIINDTLYLLERTNRE